MERIVAVKKLAKVLGKKMGYRIDAKALGPDEREAAKAQLEPARLERDRLKEQRDARYKAILEGDAEYQRLHESHKTAREHVDKLSWQTRHYKIQVGTTSDIGGFGCFHIRAEGDSWEEVIAKLQAKQVA